MHLLFGGSVGNRFDIVRIVKALKDVKLYQSNKYIQVVQLIHLPLVERQISQQFGYFWFHIFRDVVKITMICFLSFHHIFDKFIKEVLIAEAHTFRYIPRI